MQFFFRKAGFLQVSIILVLILVFFSLTGRSFRRASWHEELLWEVLSPPQKLLTWTSSGLQNIWKHYFALVDISKENAILKTKISSLEGDLIRMEELAEENKRLKSLLAYKENVPGKLIVADVIANDPRAEFKSITIDKGSKDGMEALLPVVGPKGLVGKIGKVGLHTSQVILMTDPNSAVDAVIQRSRARGMIVGASWHTELKAGYYLTRLEYLRSTSDILDGDVVVSSGQDGVFPHGIPIGTVQGVKLSKYGIFKESSVIPFENMAELQEVGILLQK